MVLFIFFLFGCFLLETDLYAGTKDEDRPSYLSLKPLRHRDLILYPPSAANPVYRLSAELLGTIATFMLKQEKNDFYVQNWVCNLKGGYGDNEP